MANLDDNRRSSEMTTAYQAEGVIEGLKMLLASGQPAGLETVAIVRKLDVDYRRFKDQAVQNWPEMGADPQIGDLLVRVQVIFRTALMFLSPEQRIEIEKSSNPFKLEQRLK